MNEVLPIDAAEKPRALAIRPCPGRTRPFYAFWSGAIRLASRPYLRATIDHPERIPATGPVLILPTHTSFLDPPLLGGFLPRETWFLARESILRTPLVGWLSRHLNAHPLRRGAGDREAIRACLAILRAGWPLVFFPEGTRSASGTLGPIQAGFAMILDKLPGVPYVPVVMQDTFRAWRRGWLLPRPCRVRIHVGEAAHLSPRAAGESTREYFERCGRELEVRWRNLGAR